jgi:hypothetical protein
MKQKKFPKELQARRPYRAQGWRSQNNLDRWAAEDDKADAEGLAVLLRHYGIDSSDASCWKQLSLAMASDFFPSFSREKAKNGPKKKWDVIGYAKLLKAVSDVVASTRQSEQSALKIVHEQHYRHITPRALENRFGEAKRHHGLNRMLERTTAPVVPRKGFAARLWRNLTEASHVIGAIEPSPTDPDGVVVVFPESAPGNASRPLYGQENGNQALHGISLRTVSVQSANVRSRGNFGQREAIPSGDGIRVRNPKARLFNR